MNFLVKGTQGLFYDYNDGNHDALVVHIDMIYLYISSTQAILPES